jgi:hypothetical protein
MRAKWWVAVMTIAVAAPFGAHAASQATTRDVTPFNKSDFWDGRVEGVRDFARLPVAVASDSTAADSWVTVVREPATIRAVDTYRNRGFEASATAAQVAAAPEMNVGLAAIGLTLICGGMAILRGPILRGRRLRVNA